MEFAQKMLSACEKEQVSNLYDALKITGLSQDSRTVQDGFLFAALPGHTLDGRDFIEDAIKKGAKAILAPAGTEYPECVTENNIPTIESHTPQKDLAALAAHFYGKRPENLYAVTGTNGKTSVAQFIGQLLSLKGKKAASLGTMGLKLDHEFIDTGMTTLDPIALHKTLRDVQEHAVTDLALEASSHGLDQDRLHGLSFKSAGFTNITQDHLDYHETMENYFQAKSRLFMELLAEDGVAVINADSQWSDALIQLCKQRHLTIHTYGKAGETIQILSQKATETGQIMTLKMNGNTHDISLPLIGFFQGMNVVCAFLMAGLSEEDLPLLSQLTAISGRMEWIAKTPAGTHVYIDYAHTPDAIETVLSSAKPHTQNELWCLFGCGGQRDATKRPLMGRAAATHADHVILTDDNPRDEDAAAIRKQAKQGSPSAIEIDDRREAIAYGLENGKDGDVFIICGKGHENGQIIQGITYPFHDGETVLSLLSQQSNQQ